MEAKAAVQRWEVRPQRPDRSSFGMGQGTSRPETRLRILGVLMGVERVWLVGDGGPFFSAGSALGWGGQC